jgi:GDP-L-fucose synthase
MDTDAINTFESLRGKRILVTGGAGFLGRHVVQELIAKGVPKTDIFVSHSADYDLRFQDRAKELLALSRPDIVICIAARLSGIGDNIARPAQYFLDNINIGLNLIEASRAAAVERFIYIGTVCSYPRDTAAPFLESDLWSGYPEAANAPYGIAKKAVGTYLQAAYQQYGFRSVQLILTNLYGPHDDFRDRTSHVIPALIKKVVKAAAEGQEELIAWGDGSPTRDFLYVTDAAAAIVRATAMHDSPEPVNVASGTEISISALLNTIVSEVGYSGRIVWDKSKPNGQPRRVLDISKAKEKFGFMHAVPLQQGIKETVRWYMENQKAIDSLPEKYPD